MMWLKKVVIILYWWSVVVILLPIIIGFIAALWISGKPLTLPRAQLMQQLEALGVPTDTQWGIYALYESVSRKALWIRVPTLGGRHATLRSTYRRAHRTCSATAVEVCHEEPRSGKTHSRRQLFLSQTDYIGRVLERFNMQSAKSASTPLPINLQS